MLRVVLCTKKIDELFFHISKFYCFWIFFLQFPGYFEKLNEIRLLLSVYSVQSDKNT
jgi:hypothetical protein